MILECITQHINNIDTPTLSLLCTTALRPCSVPTPYLLRTQVSHWSRIFWLLILLCTPMVSRASQTQKKAFAAIKLTDFSLSRPDKITHPW